MPAVVDREECVGCETCVDECEQEAIKMIEVDGDQKAEIDKEKCTECGKCAETCPSTAISIE